ncbi:hypothetical protein N431DRAFT_449916 [Stipitochalara longipes BDJ]|nr:hypothetical protein N431DRAFT_449916 [Stipitochalara longipes BDJ]
MALGITSTISVAPQMDSSDQNAVAATNSLSQFPEPRPVTAKSELNPHASGNFEYFPFVPIEVRFMIWKLAIPRPKVLTVAVEIRSCVTDATTAEGKNHGNEDQGNCDCPFVTYVAVENEFDFLAACKESRFVGIRALPNRLPTVQRAGIRFNPQDTAIRIENFPIILGSFEWGKQGWCAGREQRWLCPRSHRGQGITRLVISCENIWRTDPTGSSEACWGLYDSHWEQVLMLMFKDVNKVIAEIKVSNIYDFYEFDFRGWSMQNTEDDNDGEELGKNTKVDDGKKEELQRLENLMNDRWLDFLDEPDVQNQRQVEPKISFCEGKFGDGGILKSLPWRDFQSRFDFGQFYVDSEV